MRTLPLAGAALLALAASVATAAAAPIFSDTTPRPHQRLLPYRK